MIYLLTAIGLPSGGSCTVHIYTQTIHRTTQNEQYLEQHKNCRRLRAVPRLGELYPGICLTTEEKARKTLSQGKISFLLLVGWTALVSRRGVFRNSFRRSSAPAPPVDDSHEHMMMSHTYRAIWQIASVHWRVYESRIMCRNDITRLFISYLHFTLQIIVMTDPVAYQLYHYNFENYPLCDIVA
jgi:hypothetical protein